jgi:DNA repair protein RecN (Recombination protein N)
MIRFLSIRDLAVVDRLEVEFLDGFNVLTGETGAGKSIIVGALGLLVGVRATNDLVRTGCEKAVVQGTFEVADGGECIVRREISAQGRSRIFIDESLATVGKLKQLGKSLVDIHGQHEHQELLDPKNHVGFLDAFAGHTVLLSRVESIYREWRKLEVELRAEMEKAKSATENLSLLEFQRDEIDAVSPVEGEDDSLLIEQARLANAERLALLAAQAYDELYESDTSVTSVLGAIWKKLDELEGIDKSFAKVEDKRELVLSELTEISDFLRSYSVSVETSPERLAQVEERLSSLEDLKRKYGGSLTGVIKQRNAISEQLETVVDSRSEIERLKDGLRRARQSYMLLSDELSKARVGAAAKLKLAFEDEIGELAIPNCVFDVQISVKSSDEDWREIGFDDVEFFFSANAGEQPKSLARTASGGELSRVMLALKTLGTTDVARKTLVFDEVDAGVGGEAAERIGRRLARLGEDFQVLSVTHAPQVAIHGDEHFIVRKSDESGRTVTTINKLVIEKERAAELSRLMTGAVDSVGIDTAMALLRVRRKAKAKGESRKDG